MCDDSHDTCIMSGGTTGPACSDCDFQTCVPNFAQGLNFNFVILNFVANLWLLQIMLLEDKLFIYK